MTNNTAQKPEIFWVCETCRFKSDNDYSAHIDRKYEIDCVGNWTRESNQMTPYISIASLVEFLENELENQKNGFKEKILTSHFKQQLSILTLKKILTYLQSATKPEKDGEK